MNTPTSLRRSISPPTVAPRRKSSTRVHAQQPLRKSPPQDGQSKISGLAAVEAGKATVFDHLSYFSQHLSQVGTPALDSVLPRLSISDYVDLYKRNSHPHGHHFVIHQHNHPVAGCHYDLRLQFSESSSCSFAIPYGVPGHPNAIRQGRMAIETRVHTLWNNLIESASHATGSLLIWDTGEYEVLPRKTKGKQAAYTDDECSDHEPRQHVYEHNSQPENEKLIHAFKTRYIRLRLHGTRLPKNYTIALRLPSTNDVVKHSKPMSRKRKPSKAAVNDADSDPEEQNMDELANSEVGIASDDEYEAAAIRANNAYTGADNAIGSVHQRHWFITLDKANSGFVKKGEKWQRVASDRGFEAFYIRGADIETSVVTGRTSAEVMADEGVEGFVPRKRWRPILE
jgi:hypothetical protein